MDSPHPPKSVQNTMATCEQQHRLYRFVCGYVTLLKLIQISSFPEESRMKVGCIFSERPCNSNELVRYILKLAEISVRLRVTKYLSLSQLVFQSLIVLNQQELEMFSVNIFLYRYLLLLAIILPVISS